MRKFEYLATTLIAPLLLSVAACDDSAPTTGAGTKLAAASAPSPAPDPAGATNDAPRASSPPASSDPRAQVIETSEAGPAPLRPSPAAAPLLIKIEVLLDRAHFSPGEIDGRDGSNLHKAIAAFEAAAGLPADGAVSASVVAALKARDPGPVTQDYVITAADETGPFIGAVPSKMEDLAKLEAPGYASPLEALAEKFHMSAALLKSFNPTADFTRAGARILAVRPGEGDLPTKVAKVEVDKAAGQVRALGADGKPLAVFPATVGSTERPAPTGELDVKAVVRNPDYTYDPKRLTFGDKKTGPLRIAPGPNNPVGTTWIALSRETYGIHGTPDPNTVGKTASHGCVRLTNWDARTLAGSVSKGTPVLFVGQPAKKT